MRVLERNASGIKDYVGDDSSGFLSRTEVNMSAGQPICSNSLTSSLSNFWAFSLLVLFLMRYVTIILLKTGSFMGDSFYTFFIFFFYFGGKRR